MHARIQEFSSGGGGGPGQSDKKALTLFFFFCFFLVLGLFYRSQMVNFKEIYHFQGSRGGPTFSRGGGGSNCLFPIETHITCDFQGGSGPSVPPPLDPHLQWGPRLPPPPPLDPHLCVVCTFFGAGGYLYFDSFPNVGPISVDTGR